MSGEETLEHYMRQALTLAAEALELGEFPIAAIVVLDGKVIARATASERREKRFLGHAELVALEEAERAGMGQDFGRAWKRQFRHRRNQLPVLVEWALPNH